MKNLESAMGGAYDLEFIPHHEGALLMAKDAAQKSQKEEIRMLASEIIKAQKAETRQMKA